MLSLLLLLVTTQLPALPGETTLVSGCKQFRASACQELRKVNPKLADQIEAEARKALLRQEALRVAEEAVREQQIVEGSEAEAEAAPEPPDCKGQDHHVISRPIAKQLEQHETLRGLYKPRDERFVAKAKDKESHCGYQQWHRDLDNDVIAWLKSREKATPKQFEQFLRELYNRPDMLKRFPNGF